MRHIPLLLFLCPLAALAQSPQNYSGTSVKVALKPVATADAAPRPLFPRLPLTLRKDKPEGGAALPAPTSKAARYATVRAGGRDLVCLLDAPQGSFALGLLHAGGKPVHGKAQPGSDGFRILFRNADVGGVKLNVALEYRGNKLVAATCEPAHHMRGKAVLKGGVRDVILVDGDGDGRFDGVEDRWLALRADRTSRVPPLRRAAMMLLNEPQAPFEQDGSAYMIRDVASDGSTLLLVRGRPTMPLDRILARRYAELRAEFFRGFRREGQAFTRRSGIDTKRPRARDPITWPRGDLADAKERARKSGRPLLVAHYTESNVWWWRYVYYTFPDREVDALLRRFVLVAIDAEKDKLGSFQKSGGRSMPALQGFTPDGRPISFRLRARDQSGKARELELTTAGITGWQRPADLVVNLKRVLAAVR